MYALKKFLQNRANRQFLMPDGGWDTAPENALEVKPGADVSAILLQFVPDEDVDLYYAFDSKSQSRGWDFTIQIGMK